MNDESKAGSRRIRCRPHRRACLLDRDVDGQERRHQHAGHDQLVEHVGQVVGHLVGTGKERGTQGEGHCPRPREPGDARKQHAHAHDARRRADGAHARRSGGGFAVLVQDLDGGRGHVSFGRGTGEAHGLGFGGLLDVRALREGAFACGGPSMGAQALGSSAGDTCAGRAHGAGTCVAGGWQAPVPRARKLVFGGVRAVVELSMSSFVRACRTWCLLFRCGGIILSHHSK